MNSLILLTAFLLCLSCTSEISDKDKNKQMSCTDTRDGEKFTFNSNNIFNVVVGISSMSLDIIDDEGVKRSFTDKSEAYIKCVEIK